MLVELRRTRASGRMLLVKERTRVKNNRCIPFAMLRATPVD